MKKLAVITGLLISTSVFASPARADYYNLITAPTATDLSKVTNIEIGLIDSRLEIPLMRTTDSVPLMAITT